MSQLETIEAIERWLWSAVDTLRSSSNYASNEYFMPVMGLVFLRHAYSRFLSVKDEIEANLPKRGGKKRSLTKEDFSEKGSIFLKPEAQFDYLVSLPDSEDRAEKIIEAMESIEASYDTLRGSLPKAEYQKLDNDVIKQLLNTLNSEELQRASGDIFGRIYEYFLTQFADVGAHDGGEFFTPVSLVSLIANVLEPEHGIVLDPACGSGGMFVQSAKLAERRQGDALRLTFKGMEKNETTIRLGKMNLAVHGLEGNIAQAITSQASSAGRDEAKVREKLIASGDVEMMIAIRSNFFYTRSVPCELWFLNRAKPEEHQDKVLMIDARNIYRKVTRKIYDFSPEQLQNILAIAWLYRGETERFLELVADYLSQMLIRAHYCLLDVVDETSMFSPLEDYMTALWDMKAVMQPFLEGLDQLDTEVFEEFEAAISQLDEDIQAFETETEFERITWEKEPATDITRLVAAVERRETLATMSRDLMKQVDLAYKLGTRAIRYCETELEAKGDDTWVNREVTQARKEADRLRQQAVERLKLVRYFHKQAVWLTERFPEARLVDVPGLVALVDHEKLSENDWSLTPGRYVGVAPEEEENFDFEETLRDLHVELEGLNEEAIALAAQISQNSKELGI